MTSPCSMVLLESALTGSLPTDDESALHRHLEQCEACSTALERLAGGPAWCQEAASLLTRDELDAAVPTRDDWSDVDFTVEHLEPADDSSVLGRLGGYDVLGIIGRGGMGVVLKAFDRELKRCVAIKVLAPHLAQSSLAKKRFAGEAQAAAAVVHPNVLAIHQVQPGGRLPFLVMPLVAGESLAERLTAQGTLELKETLRIGMQAAAGLAAAHEQGLVHRDVKPANILLDKGVERAVLTDFGLARAADDVTLTRWGIIAGTPQYMSPEQVRGEPLDGHSDLFSLGCVLYEMATGVSPFGADSIVATMRRLVDDSPRAMASLNPELPPWFISVVERLLEKDPSRRFESAKEVSELLEGCLAHVQQPANVPLPSGLPKPPRRRAWISSKSLIKGVLAMIGALGIGLLGFFLSATAPPDIAGKWSGEDWGDVVLNMTSSTEYTGTYNDTSGKQPGELQLKWSHVEHRFNGTWREERDRFGEISVRLADDEIRGAYTTDPKCKINPATPRLADLAWIRPKPTFTLQLADGKSSQLSRSAINTLQTVGPPVDGASPKWIYGPVVERTVQDISTGRDCCLNLETGELLTPPADIRSEEKIADWSRTSGADLAAIEKGDDDADLGVGLRRGLTAFDLFYVGPESWDASTADSAVETIPYYKAQLARGQNGKDWLRVNPIIAKVTPLTPQDWGSRTMFFRSRGNRIGILQITEFTDNPRGVKLRYKLVSRKPKLDAASEDLSTEDRTAKQADEDDKPVSKQILISSNLAETAGVTTRIPVSVLRPRFNLLAFENRVNVLAYSPDGGTLAVANSGTVSLHDAQTGQAILPLLLLSDDELIPVHVRDELKVRALAFSPNSSVLAIGDSIGRVNLFDLRRRHFKLSLDGVNQRVSADDSSGVKDPFGGRSLDPKYGELRVAHGSVSAIAFSPDGSLLATCGKDVEYKQNVSDDVDGPNDTLINIWDANTGTLQRVHRVRKIGEPNGNFVGVAFSPDGNFLASAVLSRRPTRFGAGVQLWDRHTGKAINKLTVRGGGGLPNGIAYSADGKRLAVGMSGSIAVSNPASGIFEYGWPVPRSVERLAFSPDGKNIATFSGDQSLILWDASTGKPKHEISWNEYLEGERWECFAFAPHDNTLAIGGSDAEQHGFLTVRTLADPPADPPAVDAPTAEAENALGKENDSVPKTPAVTDP